GLVEMLLEERRSVEFAACGLQRLEVDLGADALDQRHARERVAETELTHRARRRDSVNEAQRPRQRDETADRARVDVAHAENPLFAHLLMHSARDQTSKPQKEDLLTFAGEMTERHPFHALAQAHEAR